MQEIGESYYRQGKYRYARQIFEESRIPRGLYLLGKIYLHGLEIDADILRAKVCFEQAADNGYRRAFIQLGHLARLGRTGEIDFLAAIRYYQQVLNSEKALVSLGTIYDPLSARSENGPLPDLKLALAFYKQSLSIKENSAAFYSLGIAYLPNKPEKSQMYFLNGASKKCGRCCYALATLFNFDFPLQKRFLYRAVEYKFYPACLLLSEMVPNRKSERLLKRAYRFGNSIIQEKALVKLTELYEVTELGRNRKQVTIFFLKIGQPNYLSEIYGYRRREIEYLVKTFRMEKEIHQLRRDNTFLRAHINASPDGELFYQAMQSFSDLRTSSSE